MIVRKTCPVLILVATAVSVPTASAQTNVRAVATPSSACALLSVAEVRKITGQRGYADKPSASDPSDGVAGGGTACRYEAGFLATAPEPPVVNLVLIRGKGWTQRTRTMKLPPTCKWEQVAGVGDAALSWSCPPPRSYRSPLYVKAGANDLIVQIEASPPATDASVRAITIAVAKAAAAKLR
jgi:hypothetical protein